MAVELDPGPPRLMVQSPSTHGSSPNPNSTLATPPEPGDEAIRIISSPLSRQTTEMSIKDGRAEQSRLLAEAITITSISEDRLPVTAVEDQGSESESSAGERLDVCNLGENEKVILLSMPPRIQQQYCMTIQQYVDPITRLLQGRAPSQVDVSRIHDLYSDISKVTVHIDLQGSGPSARDVVNPSHEAAYAVSCSEKFVFLSHLFDRLQSNRTSSIAIVARPGQTHDFLETFCQAKNVQYCRPAWDQMPPPQTKVLLLESGPHLDITALASVDFVVAIDDTFRQAHLTGAATTNILIVLPVVYASLEHIDLCLPTTLEPLTRMRKLILALLQTQSIVGMPDEDTAMFSALDFLFPIADQDLSWPSLQPIDRIDFGDLDPSNGEAGVTTDEAPPSSSRSPGKRTLESDPVTQRKRPRTDETKGTETLRRRIKDLESTVSDLKNWAALRQHEFEHLRQVKSETQEKLLAAESEVIRQSTRVTDLGTKNQLLAVAQVETRQQLAELQSRLELHENPTIAEIAAKDARISSLEKEVVALTNRVANTQKDFDFTRQAYQQASNAAAEMQGETSELQSELDKLRIKAESRSAEYRRLRDEDVTRELRKENFRLKTELRLQEKVLERIETDHAELKKTRAGAQTRASSAAPRSPRGFPGSRGASPATGLRGTPGASSCAGQFAAALASGHGMSRPGSRE